MARNSKGQHTQTLTIAVSVEAEGDPSAWDWETIIHYGAMLNPSETVTVHDVHVEGP